MKQTHEMPTGRRRDGKVVSQFMMNAYAERCQGKSGNIRENTLVPVMSELRISRASGAAPVNLLKPATVHHSNGRAALPEYHAGGVLTGFDAQGPDAEQGNRLVHGTTQHRLSPDNLKPCPDQTDGRRVEKIPLARSRQARLIAEIA